MNIFRGVLFGTVLLAMAQSALAVGEAPKERVWVEPAAAPAGTAVTISAFLYNDQKGTISYTLEAKAADTRIGKQQVSLPAGSAKTIVFPYTTPQKETTITVSITSALNAQKIDMPLLHGPLGVVLVGAPSPTKKSITVPATSAIGKYYDSAKSFLEVFRVKQAAAFAKDRDEARAKLGLTTVSPTPPENSGASGTSDELLPVRKMDDPMQYGMLILSTALASFFASTLMYYGALLLVGALLIRAVVKFFV